MVGRKFGAVLESDLSDSRAALNWGKALCARAELASSTALLPADEEPDPQVRCHGPAPKLHRLDRGASNCIH